MCTYRDACNRLSDVSVLQTRTFHMKLTPIETILTTWTSSLLPHKTCTARTTTYSPQCTISTAAPTLTPSCNARSDDVTYLGCPPHGREPTPPRIPSRCSWPPVLAVVVGRSLCPARWTSTAPRPVALDLRVPEKSTRRHDFRFRTWLNHSYGQIMWPRNYFKSTCAVKF